jgi:hypothetical protein
VASRAQRERTRRVLVAANAAGDAAAALAARPSARLRQDGAVDPVRERIGRGRRRARHWPPRRILGRRVARAPRRTAHRAGRTTARRHSAVHHARSDVRQSGARDRALPESQAHGGGGGSELGVRRGAASKSDLTPRLSTGAWCWKARGPTQGTHRRSGGPDWRRRRCG